MEESEKAFEIRIKSAERAFDINWKAMEAHNKQVEAFSIAAMKAPALVAAGGVAASLAFFSANYERLMAHPGAMDLFYGSMFWMLVSLISTVLAPGMAYFSQLAYFSAVDSRALSYTSPFVSETTRSKIASVIGDICRWATVIVVVASIGFVIKGGMGFLALMSLLSSK